MRGILYVTTESWTIAWSCYRKPVSKFGGIMDKFGAHVQVKEGELARVVTVFVYKAAGQMTAEDGTEIVLRNLEGY